MNRFCIFIIVNEEPCPCRFPYWQVQMSVYSLFS